jgi:hypothetical protein
MKKAILYIIPLFIVFAASSCKKCFNCQQYCAYCEAAGHTGVGIKVCATGTGSFARVDSFQRALTDSGYTCNLLQDNQDVCDNKNAVDDAYSFFQKQNYFCTEK